MTEQLLITPPCVLTPFPLPIPARPRHEPLHNDVLWWIPGKAANPPPKTLGFNLPSPCGTRLSKLGEFLNWGAEKKNYKKTNQNKKLGASLTLSHKRAQQRLEPAWCDCSVGPPCRFLKPWGFHSLLRPCLSVRTYNIGGLVVDFFSSKRNENPSMRLTASKAGHRFPVIHVWSGGKQSLVFSPHVNEQMFHLRVSCFNTIKLEYICIYIYIVVMWFCLCLSAPVFSLKDTGGNHKEGKKTTTGGLWGVANEYFKGGVCARAWQRQRDTARERETWESSCVFLRATVRRWVTKKGGSERRVADWKISTKDSDGLKRCCAKKWFPMFLYIF